MPLHPSQDPGKRILAQGSGKKEGGEWRGGRREGAWPAKVAIPLMEEILHHHALRATRRAAQISAVEHVQMQTVAFSQKYA